MSTQTERHRLLVPAETSKLCDLRETVTQICDQCEIPRKVTRRMVLAVDEAIANIIEHGQLPDSDEPIELSLEVADDRIVAEITDRGIPFDPTFRGKEPDRRSYPRRGFGLYLIHMIVDSVEYERTADGRNVLTLMKSLAPSLSYES